MKTNEANEVTFSDVLAAQQAANLEAAPRRRLRPCREGCGRLNETIRCTVGGCSVDPFAAFTTTNTETR